MVLRVIRIGSRVLVTHKMHVRPLANVDKQHAVNKAWSTNIKAVEQKTTQCST